MHSLWYADDKGMLFMAEAALIELCNGMDGIQNAPGTGGERPGSWGDDGWGYLYVTLGNSCGVVV